MLYHLDKTHICKVLVVVNQRPSHRLHSITSEVAKLRLRITRLQLGHQARSMEVATGLTSYQIVLHRGNKLKRIDMNVLFHKIIEKIEVPIGSLIDCGRHD